MEPEGYRIHKPPPSIPIPSQSNTVHSSPIHFLKIHFNIIFPSTNISCKWLLSIRSHDRNHVCTFPTPHACYMPRPSHSAWYDHVEKHTHKFYVHLFIRSSVHWISCRSHAQQNLPKLPEQHERLSWPALHGHFYRLCNWFASISLYLLYLHVWVVWIFVKSNMTLSLYTPWRHIGEWRHGSTYSWPQQWMVGVWLYKPRRINRTRRRKAPESKFDVWDNFG